MKSRNGMKWTREEIILALELYYRTPFSRIDKSNKDIVALARILGRTPSSVGLKMSNLAAQDPTIIARGVKGMSHGSKLDAEVWMEFQNNEEELANQALHIRASMGDNYAEEQLTRFDCDVREGYDKSGIVKTRIGQRFFRESVLAIYNRKCCITGLALESTLIASHIKPWKDSDPKTERANPRNGLCLNALHDKLFDTGLITIDKDYRIRHSSCLDGFVADDNTTMWLMKYRNHKIEKPEAFLPDINCIEYHNDVVFKG